MNDFLTNKVLPFAGKLQSNRWLKCISSSFMKTMPVLMIGAILSLIQGIPLGDWYTNLLSDIGLTALLSDAVAICNLTALFFVFSLGYTIGEMKNQNKFQSAVLAVLCFLIITPFTSQVADETGKMIMVTGVIPTNNLGAAGIFTALLVGILSVSIFAIGNDHKWTLRMPESVPEMVAKPFEAVIPAFVAGIVFLAIRSGFAMNDYGSLHNFIYGVIQTPLVGLGSTFPAMLLCIFLTCLLWWMGVHGTMVIMTVMMVVWTEPQIVNMNNYMAGLPVENIITIMFYMLIIQFIGGPGCLFGLYIDMAFMAKSERFKMFGKVAVAPGIFNIIEPVVFGFPIVMNPIMFIPFVFTPVIFATITYFLMEIGMVGIPALNMAVMTLPGIIAGFITGGGISLGILMIVFCLLSCVIYYPFFKVCDLQALKEEQALANAKEEIS